MKGFTLIELLVVVMIIGILSSIALPQYEMVVEKSRATEALVNVKAIRDAIQRHVQEFPEDEETGVTSFTQIADVQLKGGTVSDNTFETRDFVYRLNGPTFQVTRRDQGKTQILYQIRFNSVPEGNNLIASQDENCLGKYKSVCSLFGSIEE